MAITLTKEDGTGLTAANVYADLDDAEAYLENTGRLCDWQTYDLETRKAALIQGADYLDQSFRNRFKGQRSSSDQRLEWPRDLVYDELGNLVADIPEEVLNASVEFAYEAAASPLAPTPEVSDTGGQVILERSKVDVLETEVRYSEVQSTKNFRSYPRAQLVIRRWLRGGGSRGLTVRI